ncbi:GNAT family N-acetyltransferase [Nesterenkonia sp. F]|uniref:GNAT family N-acetyltransferase n=1 Tax=Nesterenkonia sp. F TaxID=795955 RepID=UPI000255CA1C|nr:GNAT family protein [Nesterenkonia sp. F]
MSATIRLLSVEDVEEATTLLQQNRDFLAPWEPIRDDDYFRAEKQLELARRSLDEYAQGRTYPAVILDGGAIVGRLTLSGITRGAFQSAAMGYWVSERANGRGIATRAVSEAVGVAFDELGLHRIQAETLFSNTASQRVLAKNGFRPYGVAPEYLRIDGRWRDHLLFQLIADDDGAACAEPTPGRRGPPGRAA